MIDLQIHHRPGLGRGGGWGVSGRQLAPYENQKCETPNEPSSFSLFPSVKTFAALLLRAFALISDARPHHHLSALMSAAPHQMRSSFIQRGKTLDRRNFNPHPTIGTKSWLNRAREVQKKFFPIPLRCGVGVAAPGLPARDWSFLATMPERLHGLENLNWQKWLGLKRTVPFSTMASRSPR